MSKSRFGIFIAIFILFISGILTAQDTTDQNINFNNNDNYHQQDPTMQEQSGSTAAAIEQLKIRLNLREDQVQDITDVLERYQRESATMQTSPLPTDQSIRSNANTELKNRYNSEIETLLDENQRVQFRDYSEKWWNSVNSVNGEGTEINRDRQGEGTETDIQKEGTDIQDGTDIDGTDAQKEGTDTEIDGNQNDGTNSDTNSDDSGLK